MLMDTGRLREALPFFEKVMSSLVYKVSEKFIAILCIIILRKKYFID